MSSQPATGGSALCATNILSEGQVQLPCLIPQTGRYTIAIEGLAAALTPTVRSVPPQPGRVAGACAIATAPLLAASVTQYGHTRLCPDSDEYEFWKLRLAPHDTLALQVHAQAIGSDATVGLYSPSTQTLTGAPLCSARLYAPVLLHCAIRHAGTYVLAFHQASFAFTALVVHPTRPVLDAPRVLKGGGALRLTTTIRSDAPHPTGTCLVDVSRGKAWSLAARVATTTGVCTVRVHVGRPGALRVRVRFHGARGWASSRSAPITIHVRCYLMVLIGIHPKTGAALTDAGQARRGEPVSNEDAGRMSTRLRHSTSPDLIRLARRERPY